MSALEDLVVLKYATDNCYCIVLPLKDVEDVKVSLGIGAWSWHAYKNVPIGQCRSIYCGHVEFQNGIIGVYDGTNLRHLNSMVHDTKSFTESGSVFLS